MNNYYRIYGKNKNDKKYKALDCTRGALVNNLIYATLIKETDLDKAKKSIEYMIENNPDYHFELRAV